MCCIVRNGARERARKSELAEPALAPALRVKAADGSLAPLDTARLAALVEEACRGLADVLPGPIVAETRRNLYDGIPVAELELAPILATRTLIETEPNYSKVSARLLLDKVRREALSHVAGHPDQATHSEMAGRYAEYFRGLRENRHRRRAVGSGTGPVRPRPPRRRHSARTRFAIRLSWPADAVRSLLPARPRHPVRASAGLLHARRHGARHPRDRPRGEGDRVLRPAVVVRLHGLHADAVQRRHATAAAVVLLPDQRAGRPGWHLQIHQGQRAAGEILRRAGQRLDAGPRPGRPHQGHQRREPGASSHS